MPNNIKTIEAQCVPKKRKMCLQTKHSIETEQYQIKRPKQAEGLNNQSFNIL
jgi:hypothetical protein